jgi:hypothetical protein
MGLKIFYLVFGVFLTAGAGYLAYRRFTGLDNSTTDFAIIFCTIIGVSCFIMYLNVDKLKPK